MKHPYEVKLEFPGGELTNLYPLIALGIIPKPKQDLRGITERDRWIAQGLEGKFFVIVERTIAEAIAARLGKYRSKIVDVK